MVASEPGAAMGWPGPALPPTPLGGGGAMVETIWIPRSNGEKDGQGTRHAWVQGSG